MSEHTEEISDEIYKVEKEIPGGNNIFTVYFIKGSGNVLIEPGPTIIIPTILKAANEIGITDFKYIIPTHIHMDHAGALGKLTQIFPQATTVINSKSIRHIIDPGRLIRSTKISFGNDFKKVFGSIEPVPKSNLKVVEDQETLSINGRELVIINTPGHSPHHIAIFDKKTGQLFCGEALGLIYETGTQPLPAAAPPNFDLEVYIDSMKKLRELPVKLLLYSHGGISREPEKAISSAIENTRIIGEVILKNLKASTEEDAIRRVDQFIQEHFGFRLKTYDLLSNSNGYIGYFKKQGLV